MLRCVFVLSLYLLQTACALDAQIAGLSSLTAQNKIQYFSAQAPSTRANSIEVDITLNPPVNDLVQSDISLTNATLASLVPSSDGYTLTITPLAHGNITISIGDKIFTTNESLPAYFPRADYQVDYDLLPPSLFITPPIITVGTPFSEFIWTLQIVGASTISLTENDLQLVGDGSSTCTKSLQQDGQNLWHFKITNCSPGQVYVQIPEGISVDNVGNQSLAMGTSGVFISNLHYVEFVKYSDTVTETDASANQAFTVVLNQPSASAVTVNYEINTIQSSPNSPAFHNLTNGSVTIPAGQQKVDIPYSLLGDNIINGSRILQIQISGITSVDAILGNKRIYRRLIKDDETENDSIQKIARGNGHACAIFGEGILKCWGDNGNGKLGIGSTTATSVATVVDSGVNYKFVTVGTEHTCAITVDGILKCWGANSNPQVIFSGSDSFYSTPQEISSTTKYIDVTISTASYSDLHICAITEDFDVQCWGDNSYGQLGQGNTNTVSGIATIPSQKFKAIAAGPHHTCAITNDDRVKCWGDGSGGGLGRGSTDSDNASSPVDTALSGTYKKIASGGDTWTAYSCAISTTDNLYCWGGTTGGSTPTLVENIPYKEVSVAINMKCAIPKDGGLQCWGLNNGNNRLGDGSSIDRSAPYIIDQENFNHVSVSDTTSCAITDEKTLKCWGTLSTIGGGYSDSLVPTISMEGFSNLSAGFGHACGIKASKLYCWGLNNYGQIGDGSKNTRSYPTRIDNDDYIEVAAGNGTTCAINTANQLKCWGNNTYGQVGNNSSGDEVHSPALVFGGDLYSKVTVGEMHTCAIVKDTKTVKCWGNGYQGRLGAGSSNDSLIPQSVSDASQYSAISAGATHTCGVTVAGTGKCWGRNNTGELGINSGSVFVTVPTTLVSSTGSTDTYVNIRPGMMRTCGLLTTGSLKCWGSNSSGSLGFPGTGSVLMTTFVPSSETFKFMSMTNNNICAINATDKVYCYGGNSRGSAGINSTISVTTPTAVLDSSDYLSISVGDNFVLGITTNGEVKSWGSNDNSRQGNGLLIGVPSPIILQ